MNVYERWRSSELKQFEWVTSCYRALRQAEIWEGGQL